MASTFHQISPIFIFTDNSNFRVITIYTELPSLGQIVAKDIKFSRWHSWLSYWFSNGINTVSAFSKRSWVVFWAGLSYGLIIILVLKETFGFSEKSLKWNLSSQHIDSVEQAISDFLYIHHNCQFKFTSFSMWLNIDYLVCKKRIISLVLFHYRFRVLLRNCSRYCGFYVNHTV